MRVRDFAQECGCTPQNIYKHLKTYAEQLDGHVGQTRRGRTLDDFAQDFLRDIMYPKEVSPDTIIADQAAEIDRLRSALFQASQEVSSLTVRATEAEALAERETARADKAEGENRNYQGLLQAADDKQREQAEQLAQEKSRADAAEAREQALKDRNWFQRLTRKGE